MTLTSPVLPSLRLEGEILAENVLYEQFLIQFDGEHVEWVNGAVIKMASIDRQHDAITGFLAVLLSYFLERTTGGRLLRDPMVMRLSAVGSSRAPDIQILLPERLSFLKGNEVVGPAHIAIEVVLKGSQRRDRIEKFAEYEKGGVDEYWIIDPLRRETLFYALGADGYYELQETSDGIYKSKVLTAFSLQVDWLWQAESIKISDVIHFVEAMLTTANMTSPTAE